MLNFYETHEPVTFFYAKVEPAYLLILENLDPFVSCRRILSQNMDSGILVYGTGKKIIRNFQDLLDVESPWIRQSFETLLYLGDLDYEGIRIYETLLSHYPSISTLRYGGM